MVRVSASGSPGAYTLDITIESPDTSCDRYADWWEVLTPQGELVYRRVLLHSHADEQPFSRTGGPVEIQPDTVVIVRGHMSTDGYGTSALRGSVANGFEPLNLEIGFATALESLDPQPPDCAF